MSQDIVERTSMDDASLIKEEILNIIDSLNSGKIRVADCSSSGVWTTNSWVKKAILMYMKIMHSKIIDAGYTKFFDKIPLKFQEPPQNIRVVPNAIARYGSFIGKNVVLMPSYINIGAFIGERTMIDTWATIGSCAQIGNNVHISGGVGIGGVLEPIQSNPTIIEDNCFVGARSEIVEGVIVRKNSVISMGVFIGQSTKIYNALEDTITYGEIPEGSVVIPGTLPHGKFNTCCAVIIKKVDDKTRSKTSINEILRLE